MENRAVDWLRAAPWMIIIGGAAVAIILYQHAQHTAFLISQISGGAPGPASPDQAPGPTAAPLSSSRFNGVWTPTGPAPGESLAEPNGNAQYHWPIAYPNIQQPVGPTNYAAYTQIGGTVAAGPLPGLPGLGGGQ